ncbi:hypothetical protein ASG30_05430 [Ramlibacter sp. Leaf400]|nr:hypothetical protein ASG30_05430 [Ramlibacter sp. Leaf400]
MQVLLLTRRLEARDEVLRQFCAGVQVSEPSINTQWVEAVEVASSVFQRLPRDRGSRAGTEGRERPKLGTHYPCQYDPDDSYPPSTAEEPWEEAS